MLGWCLISYVGAMAAIVAVIIVLSWLLHKNSYSFLWCCFKTTIAIQWSPYNSLGALDVFENLDIRLWKLWQLCVASLEGLLWQLGMVTWSRLQ